MIIHCFLLFYILGRKFTIFFTKVVKFFLIGDKKITACFIRMPLFLRIVIFWLFLDDFFPNKDFLVRDNLYEIDSRSIFRNR